MGTEFQSCLNWVLLGFIGFYWVLLGFTGFYWVLLGFTGFYCILLVCGGVAHVEAPFKDSSRTRKKCQEKKGIEKKLTIDQKKNQAHNNNHHDKYKDGGSSQWCRHLSSDQGLSN